MTTSGFVDQQRKLKLQMETLSQLESEFLKQLWSSPPQSSTELRERDERLQALLDGVGHLPSTLVLRLFHSLEHKARQEINKPVLLAQTSTPDSLSAELPSALTANTHAVHEEAFKVRQSAQCTQASKHKRPNGRHGKRQIVEGILQEWLKKGLFSEARRGDRAAFIDHILLTQPEIKRTQTLYRWIDEYLTHQKLVRLTPPAG